MCVYVCMYVCMCVYTYVGMYVYSCNVCLCVLCVHESFIISEAKQAQDNYHIPVATYIR